MKTIKVKSALGYRESDDLENTTSNDDAYEKAFDSMDVNKSKSNQIGDGLPSK